MSRQWKVLHRNGLERALHVAVLLITGASGFVGRALAQRLRVEGRPFLAALRTSANTEMGCVPVGAIDADTSWEAALADCHTVVHLAARVHVMHEEAADPIAAFRAVNVAGTQRLAQEAVRCGVRRLVFVSSVKVNGESSADAPFTETDRPAPADPYAVSKWEAEQALWRVAQDTGLEVVVLRPPLLYGPGARGNFEQLLATVSRGRPLPLGSVRNRRSLLFVDNLVDALIACADHPAAKGRTFLVSDGEPVSTPELVRRCARALGVAPHLWPVPVSLLRAVGALAGRRAAIERLTGSLEVDDAAIRTTLGWRPRFTMDQALAMTAAWFREAPSRDMGRGPTS